MQGTNFGFLLTDAGQPQLAAALALEMPGGGGSDGQRCRLVPVVAQFTEFVVDRVQVAVPDPGTEKAVRTGEFDDPFILTLAYQRLDPQAVLAFRKRFLEGFPDRFPQHSAILYQR